MQAGEMSLASSARASRFEPESLRESRIGFSATYSTPALTASRSAVAWVRGDGPRDRFRIVDKPRRVDRSRRRRISQADHQILFAK